MAVNGQKIKLQDLLLARVADMTTLLVWSKTKEAKKGKPPKSIVSLLLGKDETENNAESFSTPEEFERTRAKLLSDIERAKDGH